MNYFLMRNQKNFKQSQRLGMILAEARRIRELHEAGRITASEAAELLTELRHNPDRLFERESRSRERTPA